MIVFIPTCPDKSVKMLVLKTKLGSYSRTFIKSPVVTGVYSSGFLLYSEADIVFNLPSCCTYNAPVLVIATSASEFSASILFTALSYSLLLRLTRFARFCILSNCAIV